MGLFSDKCEKCGFDVKKRAKFCSKCGHGAPLAWTKCAACGMWVGMSSQVCPHCSKPMRPDEKELVSDSSLRRQPGVFVQRLEYKDIKSKLDGNGLIIEQGSCLIVMVNGVAEKPILPGIYKPDTEPTGLFKRLFGKPELEKSISLFIIDTGDIALPFEMKGLRSREDMDLDFYVEMIVRFDSEKAGAIIDNCVRGARQVKYTDISEKLVLDDADRLIQDLANSTSIDDLIKSADLRIDFENKLTVLIRKAAERLGFQLVQLTGVQFFGPAYEKLRTASGEIEKKTREIVLEKRLRETLNSDKMDKFKTDTDLKLYMEQMGLEYDVSKEKIDFELKIARQRLSHKFNIEKSGMDQEKAVLDQENKEELSSKDDGFRRKRESEEQSHKINIDGNAKDHGRTQQQKDFELGRVQKKATVEDEVAETEKWLDVKGKKNAAALKEESEKLREYSKYTVEQLASILPPDQVEKIVKIREVEMKLKMQQQDMELRKKLMEMQANLSPEQILAMNAANSPEAAKALAAMAVAKNNSHEEKVKIVQESADRMERIMEKALDANAKVAQRGADKIIKIEKE